MLTLRISIRKNISYTLEIHPQSLEMVANSLARLERDLLCSVCFKYFTCISEELVIILSLLSYCIFPYTAQKMKFSIKNFFSKCDQIRRKL